MFYRDDLAGLKVVPYCELNSWRAGMANELRFQQDSHDSDCRVWSHEEH